jgi:hypothetical protein
MGTHILNSPLPGFKVTFSGTKNQNFTITKRSSLTLDVCGFNRKEVEEDLKKVFQNNLDYHSLHEVVIR